MCIAGRDNDYDKTQMIALSDQHSHTICVAHAHAELSVELCLAAAKHSVQQLLFVLQSLITLEVMALGNELGITKFTGKHSLNVELQSLGS